MSRPRPSYIRPVPPPRHLAPRVLLEPEPDLSRDFLLVFAGVAFGICIGVAVALWGLV